MKWTKAYFIVLEVNTLTNYVIANILKTAYIININPIDCSRNSYSCKSCMCYHIKKYLLDKYKGEKYISIVWKRLW